MNEMARKMLTGSLSNRRIVSDTSATELQWSEASEPVSPVETKTTTTQDYSESNEDYANPVVSPNNNTPESVSWA